MPWRKRQRGDQPVHPGTPPQSLRSTMSAPIGVMEAAAAHATEEASDGEWSMQGPYNFDRWRDMIERQVCLPEFASFSHLATYGNDCNSTCGERQHIRAASWCHEIPQHQLAEAKWLQTGDARTGAPGCKEALRVILTNPLTCAGIASSTR